MSDQNERLRDAIASEADRIKLEHAALRVAARMGMAHLTNADIWQCTTYAGTTIVYAPLAAVLEAITEED